MVRAPSLSIPHGRARRREGAVYRHLAEHPWRGDAVTGEPHPVSTVDRWPVAPGESGLVEGTGSTAGRGLAPPGDPISPTRQAQIRQTLQSGQSLRLRLAIPHRQLRLNERVVRRSQRRIRHRVALQESAFVQIGHDEHVLGMGFHTQVQQYGTAAVPPQRVVAGSVLTGSGNHSPV